METKKIGFLETYNSDSGLIEKSDTRLKTTITLFVGLLFAGYLIVAYPTIDPNSLILVLTIIGYAFGAKVTHSIFSENKSKTKQDGITENAAG